jgi:gamma-glutamyltranspeptidase/glutathione hydrolase
MEAGSANQYAPGKRPFHTIIPGFATKVDAAGAETPWMSFGVMGGNIQPQGHAQIMANIIDFGMNPQEAGDAARCALSAVILCPSALHLPSRARAGTRTRARASRRAR